MRVAQANLHSHTIILLQPLPDRRSRTFLDFETVGKAVDGVRVLAWQGSRHITDMVLKRGGASGVCGLFEKRLKELNPQKRQITYDVQGAGQGDLSLAWFGR